MGLVTRTLTVTLMGLTLATGCTLHESYPPALPARPAIPWDNSPLVAVTAPPPELAWQGLPRPQVQGTVVPTKEEWAAYRRYTSPTLVCRGKGKKRRCQRVDPSPIDQANAAALVRPTARHTRMGTNAQTRYQLDLQTEKMYEVQTSPTEATWLLLPEGERLAAKLLLNPTQWEVSYGKNGAEGSRREVLAIRPLEAPLQARGLLMLQSGVPIHMQVIAQERPGMLSVSWEVPERAPAPAAPTPDQLPPQFATERRYDGYTLALQGKPALAPAWMPEAVLDDGKNTLIKFPGTLEGLRVPVVQGIQHNGTRALVQSRLYVRQDHGAWMYMQGLWPAFTLTDSAGVQVKVVRQVPQVVAAKSQVY